MHLNVFLTLAILHWNPAVHEAAQEERVVKVGTDSARPLMDVLDILEKRYGWVITYEDPPYMYAGEISDVTRKVSRNYTPDKPRVLVPRGRGFEFRYRASNGSRDVSPSQVLDAILERYHDSGNPGRFRWFGTERAFHVIPVMTRNEQGVFEPHLPILDSPISVPFATRTALEMIEAIAQQVSAASGVRVVVGTVPINLLQGRIVQDGARNEPARLALLRTLATTGRKSSWRLLTGPGLPYYVLNLHLLPEPR